MFRLELVVSVLLATTQAAELKFPSGFKFGAATAAYQVEGAWNISDKSPSIWDTFSHDDPERIMDKSNGDVACDSYHLWETDIAIAKELGLHFYRFSLSWPRLLPNGFANYVSEDGRRYYNNLIDGLIKAGIEPVVTLYHWDLPQKLQDLGGWTNLEIVVWFEDYARIAFTLFGDRVRTWVTMNEPLNFCDSAYTSGNLAPGIISPGIGNYICAKNVMLAHARAYRLYDKEFRAQFHGKVGLTHHYVWYKPHTPKDAENTELARNLVEIYAHPICSKDGGWPPTVEAFIAKKSREQGYSKSRLPAFTQEEIEFVRGSFDFYGLNYYTSRLVKTSMNSQSLSWPTEGCPELGLAFTPDPSWNGYSWLISYPPGLRELMNWLRQQYGNIEFQIMENGYATSEPDVFDLERVEYLKDHLEQVLLAMTEDGLNITAYTLWSLLDNYEWAQGYTSRFGIVSVDFADPLRKRTPRASAYYYASVIKNHSIDPPGWADTYFNSSSQNKL